MKTAAATTSGLRPMRSARTPAGRSVKTMATPGKVEQGVLGGAQAQVEKEDGEDGIIKARVEEDAEKDEAPPVAVGIGHSISSIHVGGIWPKLGK